MYIHQTENWPNFTWDQTRIGLKLAKVNKAVGFLEGRLSAIGFNVQQQATVEALTHDIVASSEIEGVVLNSDQVRSSVARRMGVHITNETEPSHYVEGVVEMMLDAVGNYAKPLTDDRLFGWHNCLFPTGRTGMEVINVGKYRVDDVDVISGTLERKKVHYHAPAAELVPGEIEKFLGWFNASDELVESISAGSTGDITLTAKWAEFPVLVSTYGGIQIFENEDKTKTAVIDGTSEETVIIPTADNVSVDQVVFNRDFSGGVKSTVMFPFTVSLNDVGGGDFWEFLAMEYSSETGWLFRIKEPDDNELKANKPYIFIADQESKNIEFNLSSSVSLSTDAMNPSVHNGWAFKGVYEKVSFNEVHPEWKYAYGYSGEQKRNVTKGSFIRLKSTGFEKIDLAPMRAYLVYDKSLAKSARISDNANIGSLPEFIDVEIVGKKGLAIGGGVLNTTTGELKMDRWYDLRGRKLNGKPTTQGTYYYNGKRIIVR